MVSMFTTQPTQALNPNGNAVEAGITGTRGGYCSATFNGGYFTRFGFTDKDIAKQIHIGGSGNLVILDTDGIPIPFFNKPTGAVVVERCVQILPSFDFGGEIGVVTTTATLLTWVGGQK